MKKELKLIFEQYHEDRLMCNSFVAISCSPLFDTRVDTLPKACVLINWCRWEIPQRAIGMVFCANGITLIFWFCIFLTKGEDYRKVHVHPHLTKPRAGVTNRHAFRSPEGKRTEILLRIFKYVLRKKGKTVH